MLRLSEDRIKEDQQFNRMNGLAKCLQEQRENDLETQEDGVVNQNGDTNDQTGDLDVGNLPFMLNWLDQNSANGKDHVIFGFEHINQCLQSNSPLDDDTIRDTISTMLPFLLSTDMDIISLSLYSLSYISKKENGIRILLEIPHQEHLNNVISTFENNFEYKRLTITSIQAMLSFLISMAQPQITLSFYPESVFPLMKMFFDYNNAPINANIFIFLKNIFKYVKKEDLRHLKIFTMLNYHTIGFERLKHFDEDFIPICKFLRCLMINNYDSFEYLPKNFEGFCLNMLQSGNSDQIASYINLLYVLVEQPRIAPIILTLDNIMPKIFEIVEEGGFKESVAALRLISNSIDEQGESMRKWIIRAGTLDFLIRYIEMENGDILNDLIYSIATISNAYMQESIDEEIIEVVQNSKELIDRLEILYIDTDIEGTPLQEALSLFLESVHLLNCF